MQSQTLYDKSENWLLIAECDQIPGNQFTIDAAGMVLGRSQHCDVVIPDSHLSRQHARLQIKGDRLVLQDLGSSNGTFVNDKRVTHCILRPGDLLRLDSYCFRVEGPDSGLNATMIRPAITPVQTGTATTTGRPGAPDNTRSKQWITRPTSPGNREEIQVNNGRSLLLATTIALCVFLGATILYVAFNRFF